MDHFPAPVPNQKGNPEQQNPDEAMDGVFLDGTDLFKEINYAIYNCLSEGPERRSILAGLSRYKNDDNMLEVIRGYFISPIEKDKLIKKDLNLSRYPGKSIRKIREFFQKTDNK